MSPFAAVACGLVAALFLRPWRVRPRAIRSDAHATTSPTPSIIGALPGGVLWGIPVVVATVVHPVLGIGVTMVPALRECRRRRAVHRHHDRSVVRSLPEVVDLLMLGVGAGLSVRAALARSERWLPPPFGEVFGEARRRSASGESFAVALEATAATLGEAAHPLVAVIVGAEHTAGPLLPTLERVGDDARRRRKVQAQERARRLPVTMLAPLMLCVLPAFGLLAVAPVMLTSLRDLGMGP